MADRVLMWHPDVPDTRSSPVERDRRQFERVWKPKGWRLWTPSTARKKETDAEEKETD